ncbi:MAG: phage scaffolding protein [Longibaculum sp.]
MDWLKEFLGEELYSQVEAKLKGNDKIKLANLASGEYVSKAKYDDDIKDKDVKIGELTDKVKEFDGVDIEKFQDDIKAWETKYADDIATEKKNSAIKLAVALSKPKNEKALMALLDTDIIKVDDKGNVTGLKEQLENIKKDNDFLFESEDVPPIQVKLNDDHHNKKIENDTVSLSDAVSEHYNEGE